MVKPLQPVHALVTGRRLPRVGSCDRRYKECSTVPKYAALFPVTPPSKEISYNYLGLYKRCNLPASFLSLKHELPFQLPFQSNFGLVHFFT